MIVNPVGISFINGQGTSSILCNVERNTLYIIEYLYQNKFAMKHYSMNMIQNVNLFPHCQYQPYTQLSY